MVRKNNSGMGLKLIIKNTSDKNPTLDKTKTYL